MHLKSPYTGMPFAFSNAAGVRTAPEPVAQATSAGAPRLGRSWLPASGADGLREGQFAERRVFRGGWVQVAYALIDICCVIAAGIAAFFVRFSGLRFQQLLSLDRVNNALGQPLSRYGGFLFLYVVLILLFCEAEDLYRTPRTRSASEEFLAVGKALGFATLLLIAFLYLSGDKSVSRLIVLGSLLLNIVAFCAWRYAKRRLVIRRVEQGIASRNVAIIGAGVIGQALAQQLEANKHLGYRFKGFLDQNHTDDPRTLGTIGDFSRVVRAQFIDEVFITIPSERELVKSITVESRRHRLDVKVVPELYDGLAWHAPICHIGDFPLMDLRWQPIQTRILYQTRH